MMPPPTTLHYYTRYIREKKKQERTQTRHEVSCGARKALLLVLSGFLALATKKGNPM